MHASLRREVQHCLHDNLSSGAGHCTDQVEIWNNIAAKSKRMKVNSPTMAMSDVFKHCEGRISEYSDSFHLMDHQVGALFAIDGAVIGLECFASKDTFGRFFNKLVNSYAMDAIESIDKKAKVPSVPPARAKTFVESIKKAKGQRHSVVSIGATIFFESRIAQGTALADGSKILHLSGFRKNDKLVSNGLGFQRLSASQSRRWRSYASGCTSDSEYLIIIGRGHAGRSAFKAVAHIEAA
jgi:hypothetical protein